jgi:hypothetical protein
MPDALTGQRKTLLLSLTSLADIRHYSRQASSTLTHGLIILRLSCPARQSWSALGRGRAEWRKEEYPLHLQPGSPRKEPTFPVRFGWAIYIRGEDGRRLFVCPPPILPRRQLP